MDLGDMPPPARSLDVALKRDGFGGRRGRLVSTPKGLEVVGIGLRGKQVRPIRVPPDDVVLVVPYMSVPWYRVALQLGDGRAAIVPFWKREKLELMLREVGATPHVRRSLIRLTPTRGDR